MTFDKVKTSLFVSTILLLVISIVLGIATVRQSNQKRHLQNKLNATQKDLDSIKSKQDTTQNKAEKIIKEFYKTVYNYDKSQKEISMTTVKELATDNIYKELQNEINVNNSYSPQQNIIQKSTVKENEIKILAYASSGNSLQYLVTAPIYQVFNGTKNNFEINQIIQIENQKITKRTTIKLGQE
ncbi:MULTISPECIES: hypothetical protein [Pseudolactococcus]|jgi:uncharacterized membrane-anchored protein YhcB (DUF1043 family)|uniref:Uncharacterized protein Phi n=1 Tax=Pseudolactococcus piscium MKFS47 TaxID=297352 RepID=A0A0D6DZX2_9LACT|nr:MULTISPECIES: hypothetical protein [Lactococcus]MBQ2635328.1 hypothetical protein [Methanobrevibacter sp.]MBQ3641647.1 hypothetical protein [bacterium]MBQ2652966.1 hypothetical protein [Methanobrevibacter sp.]MCJ1971144.1 hypothetical protein [Lactococcus carnosus]CEN29513.1 Uncharacterized protein Phi [Lactococcus piscium MKFS47]